MACYDRGALRLGVLRRAEHDCVVIVDMSIAEAKDSRRI